MTETIIFKPRKILRIAHYRLYSAPNPYLTTSLLLRSTTLESLDQRRAKITSDNFDVLVNLPAEVFEQCLDDKLGAGGEIEDLYCLGKGVEFVKGVDHGVCGGGGWWALFLSVDGRCCCVPVLTFLGC